MSKYERNISCDLLAVAVASMILRKLDFFRKSTCLNLGGIFVRVVLFSLYRMVVLA